VPPPPSGHHEDTIAPPPDLPQKTHPPPPPDRAPPPPAGGPRPHIPSPDLNPHMLAALTCMDPLLPRRGSRDSFQEFLAVLSSEHDEDGTALSSLPPSPPPAMVAALPPLPPVMMARAGNVAALVQPPPATTTGLSLSLAAHHPPQQQTGGEAGAAAAGRPAPAPALPPPPPPARAAPPAAPQLPPARGRRGRGRARTEHGPETAQQRAHRRFYVRKKERVSRFVVVVVCPPALRLPLGALRPGTRREPARAPRAGSALSLFPSARSPPSLLPCRARTARRSSASRGMKSPAPPVRGHLPPQRETTKEVEETKG